MRAKGTPDADDDEIDEVQFEQVTRAVHAIIDGEAARLGGDTRRIAIGGNSQGGPVRSRCVPGTAMCQALGGKVLYSVG